MSRRRRKPKNDLLIKRLKRNGQDPDRMYPKRVPDLRCPIKMLQRGFHGGHVIGRKGWMQRNDNLFKRLNDKYVNNGSIICTQHRGNTRRPAGRAVGGDAGAWRDERIVDPSAGN